MRWLIGTLGVLVLAACGDDDDTVRVRLPDAGGEAGIADAGADARRKPASVDPPDTIVPNPFWHVEHPPDSKRTWLVSPSGTRTFVLGVDSVFREDGCNGMSAYTRRATDAAATEWRRLTDTFHFNSGGAFGNLDVAGAPYAIVLSAEPRGDDRALRDATGKVLVNGLSGSKMGDPFNPAFIEDFQAELHEKLELQARDDRLQIIYLGHENGIFDIAGPNGGVRDFRRWIWSQCPVGSTLQKPRCAPHALLQSLHTTYPDIAALDAAWATTYATFEAINQPPPACNATCQKDFLAFVRDRLLPTWVGALMGYARLYALKHVIASPRLALGTSKEFHFFSPADTWIDDGQSIGTYDPYPLLSKFDLVALDAYAATPTYEEPWFSDGIHKLQADSQLPAIVSEMGTRATIPGWSNSEGPLVLSQAERGDRYTSQLAQLSAFPDVVGVVWHEWSDRFVAAERAQGTQANEGLVQCDDPVRSFSAGAPWTEFVGAVSSANLSAPKIE